MINCFPANRGKRRPREIFLVAKEFVQRILYTPPCRLNAPFNAASGKRFAGHAGKRINIVGRPAPIFVRDPRHDRFVGAHVGRENILTWAKEIVPSQLLRKPSRDPLEFLALPI